MSKWAGVCQRSGRDAVNGRTRVIEVGGTLSIEVGGHALNQGGWDVWKWCRRKTFGREQKESRKIGNHRNPAVLTGEIKQACTIQALPCTYSVQESHLNEIDLSDCWISLGRLASESAG